MALLTSKIRTRRATLAGMQSLTCRTHTAIVEMLSQHDNTTPESNLKKTVCRHSTIYNLYANRSIAYTHGMNIMHSYRILLNYSKIEKQCLCL
jgi:hypothetical protein